MTLLVGVIAIFEGVGVVGYSRLLVAVTSLMFLPCASFASVTQEVDLLELAERFCLDADGDHQLTWAIAAHDGFVPLKSIDFPGLRAPGTREIKGYTSVRDGAEVRVITGVNRWAYGPHRSGDAANFHLCWVSAKPASRPELDRAVQSYFPFRRFRQASAFAYAWVVQSDGTRVGVRRSQFNRLIESSRDLGMRTLLTSEAEGWVSVTYMRPVETCGDWCY